MRNNKELYLEGKHLFHSYKLFWLNFFKLNGRSRRRDFWWPFLINSVIEILLSAVVVAYVGIIGFIGMIIPQLIRRFYCHYHLGILMLLNILIGGVIMLMADFIGGTILQPIQIPASIIIALLGVPVLFYILITQSKV